jgi:hypothetical protein
MQSGCGVTCVWQSKAKKFSASRKRPRFAKHDTLKTKIF